MKIRTMSVLVALLLLFPIVSNSAQFVGGKGLFYTISPLANTTGQLSLHLVSRGYYRSDPAMRHAVAAANIYFGFSNHVELGIIQVLYQDFETEVEQNPMIPGITIINFKLGNFNLKSGTRALYYGLNSTIQYRTARHYNIYLEPYVNEGITGGMDLLFAYFWKPFYLYESPALYLNLGYKNHNDKESITQSTQNIVFALAFAKPGVKYEYSLEAHGEFFMERPDSEIYSRENFLYLSPGFKYRLYMGVSLGLGVDILAYSEDEKSKEDLLPPGDWPQYPEWRVNFRIDYIPSTAFYSVPTFGKVQRNALSRESLREQRLSTEKKALFEWIVDETKGAEYIDLDLEKIREERKKAEEELEKLKEEINKTGK